MTFYIYRSTVNFTMTLCLDCKWVRSIFHLHISRSTVGLFLIFAVVCGGAVCVTGLSAYFYYTSSIFFQKLCAWTWGWKPSCCFIPKMETFIFNQQLESNKGTWAALVIYRQPVTCSVHLLPSYNFTAHLPLTCLTFPLHTCLPWGQLAALFLSLSPPPTYTITMRFNF